MSKSSLVYRAFIDNGERAYSLDEVTEIFKGAGFARKDGASWFLSHYAPGILTLKDGKYYPNSAVLRKKFSRSRSGGEFPGGAIGRKFAYRQKRKPNLPPPAPPIQDMIVTADGRKYVKKLVEVYVEVR